MIIVLLPQGDSGLPGTPGRPGIDGFPGRNGQPGDDVSLYVLLQRL